MSDSTDPVIDPTPTPVPASEALRAKALASKAADDAADSDESAKAKALADAKSAWDAAVGVEATTHNQKLSDTYAYIAAFAAEQGVPLPPLPTVG